MGGDDTPDAPVFWNLRGPPEIVSLSKMKSRVQEHHKQTASLWLPKHTRAALFDFKKENAIKDGIDPSM